MYRALNTEALGISTSFKNKVRLAKKFGFTGVEINPGEIQIVGEAQVLELLHAADLQAAGCGLPIDCRAPEASYHNQLAELPRRVEMVNAVGCDRFMTWIPSGSNELPFRDNFAFHIERLRPIAVLLAAHNCRLGMEFIGPVSFRSQFRYDFLHTLDGMLALCAAVGIPNLGLLLDCWHWYTSSGIRSDIEKLQDRDVVYVHINDAPVGIALEEQVDTVRALPGETGVIDIAGFLEALQKIGYQGPVVVEPFSADLQGLSPEAAVEQTAQALDKIWKW
jgi:sugar phosphate isomerase/epimerase